MSIADAIKNSPSPWQSRVDRCLVGRFLDTLDEDDAQAFSDALEQGTVGRARLAQIAFQEAGVTIGLSTLSTHKARNCCCKDRK